MDKTAIFFDDIPRWLFGQSSPEFLIEIFIRTILIYLILLLTVRLLGSRMASQATVTEMAVMITLGAIVSPVMQIPDRGLVFGVIGLVCALLFQRGLNFWAYKYSRIETITQGHSRKLVADGVINLKELKRCRITRQQLFTLLRGEQIYSLGEVQRAYLEACGILSIYRAQQPRPGLALLPPKDPEALTILANVNNQVEACGNCGHTCTITETDTTCRNCTMQDWQPAYLPQIKEQ